ncbi:MAG: OsmC family peroxiredoxin [Synergistales bacterium]|nr:OsmC family peroxiredoxin [Synergistales bacterium]
MGSITVSTTVRPEDLAICAVSGEHSLVMAQSKQNGGLENTLKPMEVVLAALGGCITMVALARAPREDLHLRDLRLVISGDYSAAGGFGTIRIKVQVKSFAPKERLEQFFRRVEQVCPVSNSLKGKIELEVIPEKE